LAANFCSVPENFILRAASANVGACEYLEDVMTPKPVYGPPPKSDRSSGPFTAVSTLIALAATTLVTTGVGSLFQYVSWLNSARLEDANSHAKRSSELYEKVAQSIGKRHYSTYLYLAAVRDIVNTPANDGDLTKFYLNLNHHRLDQFYREIQSWNENYDKLLTSVDFVFDGPFGVAELVENAKLAKISCDQKIVDQFGPQRLNYNSLKIQLAAINHCFVESITEFGVERDKALRDATYRIDEAKKEKANIAINNVASMANEFRCHALFRVQYFQSVRQNVVSPVNWVSGTKFDKEKSAQFFEDAWKKCKLTK
jgi:hypothetical protein